jgi:hypothetical protein
MGTFFKNDRNQRHNKLEKEKKSFFFKKNLNLFLLHWCGTAVAVVVITVRRSIGGKELLDGVARKVGERVRLALQDRHPLGEHRCELVQLGAALVAKQGAVEIRREPLAPVVAEKMRRGGGQGIAVVYVCLQYKNQRCVCVCVFV